jgi:predicted dehydrogenase
MIGIGVLGLGSVFWSSYRPQIERLARKGRVELRAIYDIDESRRRQVGEQLGVRPDSNEVDLIHRDDVDLIMVLTSMPDHGRLALAGMEAGKHVLVEKPMATNLEEAARLVEIAKEERSILVCAPHVLLAPTYREMWHRVHNDVIGELNLARARYGWSGPWWGPWFYREGGGALFDLGCYNVTSLCGFMGSVRRVSGMVGTRVPKRSVDGITVDVEVEDNAMLTFDHGDNRFSTLMTGFTLQRYQGPAVELYGSTGSMQMFGHDWAPEGFEQWRNDAGVWEVFPETNPHWHWTHGFEHLIDQLEVGGRPLTRPEHAYHVLEIMQAAKRSSAEGRFVEIESEFPQPDYTPFPVTPSERGYLHDPRMVT